MTDLDKLAKSERQSLLALGDGAPVFPGTFADLISLWHLGLVACNANNPDRRVYPTRRGLALRNHLKGQNDA